MDAGSTLVSGNKNHVSVVCGTIMQDSIPVCRYTRIEKGGEVGGMIVNNFMEFIGGQPQVKNSVFGTTYTMWFQKISYPFHRKSLFEEGRGGGLKAKFFKGTYGVKLEFLTEVGFQTKLLLPLIFFFYSEWVEL